MRFEESFINEIKMRIPISRIIGAKVTFDTRKSNSSKGNFWACCPFHVEKTPSFCCNDHKASYHCFGCQESGDIFNFIMKIEGLSFFQAVEKLADLAGLELPKFNEAQQKKHKNKTTIYEILEKTNKFFEENLQKKEANEARIYLQNRKLSAHTIENFQLGFASAKKFLLKNYLNEQNISDAQMLEAGLLAKSENDGSLYERFNNRIIFPIKDAQNRIIGFGGRALQQNAKAKYINTAETSVFIKGRNLYNLKAARDYCYKNRKIGIYETNNANNLKQELIVVEGYMDVISMHQAGFKNAVAPLGTALTEEQVKLLWQTSLHPILCFDGDDAGLRAAYRTIDRMLPILEPHVSLRFALLPKGLDPDDIIKNKGKEAFSEYLKEAKSLLDLLWQKETLDKDFSTPEKCAVTEKTLLTAAQTIKNTTLKQHYLQILKVKWKNFLFEQRRDKFFKKANNNSNSITKNLVKNIDTNIANRENILIALLLQNPNLFYKKYEEIENIVFVNKDFNELHKTMLTIVRKNEPNLTAIRFKELLQKQLSNINLNAIEEKIKYIGVKTNGTIEDNIKLLEQILYLYHKAYVLKEQLNAAEKQIENDESFFTMLVNSKKVINELENSFITKDK